MPRGIRFRFAASTARVIALGTGVLELIGRVVTFVKRTAGGTAGIVQGTLFGGWSGPRRDHWNLKVPVKWSQYGGDWLDVNGDVNGAVPYATFVAIPNTSGTPIRYDVNVTTLVSKQRSTRNNGVLLRSIGSSRYAAKWGGQNSSNPPSLSVIADGVTYPCQVTATGVASDSTSSYTDGLTQFFAQYPTVGVGYVQFDMSGIPASATVTSATMTLWHEYMGGSTSATIQVHDMYPPIVPVGNNGEAPLLGLAWNYVNDVGIDAHPDVIFAADFSNIQEKPLGPWDNMEAGSIFPIEQIPLSNGRVAMRCGFGQTIPADALYGGLGGGGGDVYLWTGVDTTTYPYSVPIGAPDEVYFRYYLLLEGDWGDPGYANTFNVAGAYKMPGFGMRWGKWMPSGYWQNVSGNGGVPGTGLVAPSTKYPEGGPLAFHGNSARGHGDGSQWDGNPYDEYFSLKHYIYHIDQNVLGDPLYGGLFGYDFYWGGMVGKNKWHCVEQYLKMNSIDLTNPDQYGNGVGRRDGIIKTWIDGKLYGELTGVRWRHHPAFGIENVWLDFLHGGQSPASNIMRDQHYQMTDVVIARSYIGPRNEGVSTPSWVPAPGELKNMSADIAQSFASQVPSWYQPSYSVRVLKDESGRAANLHWGSRGAVVCFGGGHAGTNENTVYVFDLDDLKWKRASVPTDFGLGAGANDITSLASLTSDDWGEYPDGQPSSCHSYDGLVIIPPANGGGTYGSLMMIQRPACGYEGDYPNVVRTAHAMPFNSTTTTSTWERHVAAPGTPFGGTYAGTSACYDPNRNRVWQINPANATNTRVEWYDVATRTYGYQSYTSYSTQRTISTYGVASGSMTYDEVHDVLIHTGSPSTGIANVCYLRCSDPAAGWVVPTLSQTIPTRQNKSVPMGYCPDTNKWYFLTSGDLSNVYEVTIPGDITLPWTVTPVAFAGAGSIQAPPTAFTHWVRSKCWSWFPAAKCFIHVEDTTTIYAYRPYGT